MSVSQLWGRHSGKSIRSSLGYVIERTTYPGKSPDTVFFCWKPDGAMLGGSSGDGIDAAKAKAMCDRHAGIG